ncbi:DUF58 domain-containing protein [Microbacterium bovistercoris]|nr:DUF58 domain-containing protein [Microbacterium bovistercoris]
MRRRPLTLRGVGCLLCGILLVIAANLVAAPVLIYLAVLLFALPLVAAIAVHLPRRSGTVSRVISTDLLTVGETSRVTVRFDLRALRAPYGLWRDELPAAVSGDASGEYERGSASLRYQVTGERRGVSALGPLLLRTVDPFGLAQREQQFGDTSTITVVPQVVALDPLPVRVGASGGSAHSRSSRLGPGSDNLTPRHYVPGDSMRRIHWRATAHRGDLMVRQEEEEASPDAIVVLDRAASRWARPGIEADPLFETAVSLCASVAIRLVQDGYGVDVIDSAGQLLGSLRGHEDDRDGLLVALATISPRGESRDIGAVIGASPPGPLVVITGALSEADADRLRSAGAAAPILFAAGPGEGALPAAAAHGWRTAEIDAGTDLAEAWQDVIPMPGAQHG